MEYFCDQCKEWVWIINYVEGYDGERDQLCNNCIEKLFYE